MKQRKWGFKRLFSNGGITTLEDGAVTATITGADPSKITAIQAAMQPQTQPEGKTLIIRNYSLGPDQGPRHQYGYLALPITHTLIETLRQLVQAGKSVSGPIRPDGTSYCSSLRGQGFYFNDLFAEEHRIPTAYLLDERRIDEFGEEHYRWDIVNQNLSTAWSAPGVNVTDFLTLYVAWTGGAMPYIRIMGKGDDKYTDHITEMVYIDLLSDELGINLLREDSHE